jgi:hypothetical protein
VRYKPSVWVLTVLIAAACGLAVWGVVLFRSRPLSPAALIRRMPAQNGLVVYVNFAALRQAGILKLLSRTNVGEEPEYQAFVRKIEFDYKQDLDSAMLAVTKSGKFLLLSGRFDWNSLHSYVQSQGGSCYNTFCQLDGSTDDRRISFCPIRPNLMAMGVSPDNSAALRLLTVTPAPAPEVPSAPVWLSVPAAMLSSAENLPEGARAFAGDFRSADRLTLAFFLKGDRVNAELDVRCRNEKAATEITRQLTRTTTILRDAMTRENHLPNPADFSGVLAAGTFRSQGSRVFGTWPIERVFLENVLGGS